MLFAAICNNQTDPIWSEMTWHKRGSEDALRTRKRNRWIAAAVITVLVGFFAAFPISRFFVEKNIMDNGITGTAYSTGTYEVENVYVRRAPDYENYRISYKFEATDGKTYTVQGRAYQNYGVFIDNLIERLDGQEVKVVYLEDDPSQAIIQDENWK